MIVASFLGLMLAVGLALFLEYMDATVNTPQSVWSAVSLTTLGVIPHLKSLPEKYRTGLLDRPSSKYLESPKSSKGSGASVSRELIMARDQLSLTAESYRTIRTALLLAKAEHPPKVILLTSPSPGEGKTLTTVNLGIALAQSGQSVAVIDADLRKGRCHKLVNVSNESGLANVLAGQIALRSALRQTNVKNFFVLPRGGLPPSPADLLMSRKMQEVLNELRNSFDFVLIDSPPAIAVSDAAVLSAFCDGVLFVFHGQKTTAQAARQAVERMDGVNATLLGVILNGVDIRNPDYVDYRSYYPTYYASMQEEFRSNRHATGEIWESHDIEGDSVIGTAEDLDRVMKDLGFEQRRNADNGEHKGNGAARIGGVVPRQFFDRIASQLGESLGANAFSTMADQMSELGESIDSFPKARIWELAQQLSRRIIDSQSRARFLRAVSKDIQTHLSA